jgi:GDP-D-mannose 3', 5'-epimerase
MPLASIGITFRECEMQKTAIVCGGNGFIARHLIRRLKRDGYYVKAFGRHSPSKHLADEYITCDLRFLKPFDPLFNGADEVYQLACEVGGLGYILDPANDVDMLTNSLRVNLNVLDACYYHRIPKVFYASSACVYPTVLMATNKFWTEVPLGACFESDAYPARQDIGEHAWEKLTSERIYLAYGRRYGMQVRIARYHNTFGPECTWQEPRAKVIAALCRKVAELPDSGGIIKCWGNGNQVRSFVHVEDVIEGTVRLMASDFQEPINIGSNYGITIEKLIYVIAEIAGKPVGIEYVDGPVGVRGRNSDNSLIKEKLGWEPSIPLSEGLVGTYRWVAEQVDKARSHV